MPRDTPPQKQADDTHSINFLNNTRAVSIPVDYVLGLMILLTLSGVFVGGVQQISDAREEAVIEQELDRIGSEVASSLVEAETLADEAETRESRTSNDGAVNITTRVSLPSKVNDNSYAVSVEQSTNNVVTITVQSTGIRKTTNITVRRDVEPASTGNDDLIITYDETTGNLVLVDAQQ